jgi:hypothetical protein
MLEQSFENAGEKAVGANVAYDSGHAYSPVRVAGLSAGVLYSQESSAINPSSASRIHRLDKLYSGIQYLPSDGPPKDWVQRLTTQTRGKRAMHVAGSQNHK